MDDVEDTCQQVHFFPKMEVFVFNSVKASFCCLLVALVFLGCLLALPAHCLTLGLSVFPVSPSRLFSVLHWFVSFRPAEALVQILCNTWGASRETAVKGVESLRGNFSVVRLGRDGFPRFSRRTRVDV